MRLHTKLVLSLVAVLVLVVGISQLMQYQKIKKLISGFSQSNIQTLKEREEGFAKNIHSSIERAVAGSLERGEMEKFTKLLKVQKEVEGLLEFSLYNRNGVVTHSIDSSFLGKNLPHENKDQLLTKGEMLLVWSEDAIEIYEPQEINGDCIRCHTSWKQGEIGGVTGLRFSTAALDLAQEQAVETISEMKKAAILNSFLSVIGILIVFSSAIYLLTKRFVSRPLDNSVEMLKDIAEGEGDLTKRLDIISNDEVGSLAKWFNSFVEKLQRMFRNIAGDVETLASASTELAGISSQMSDGIDGIASHLSAVDSSAGEMSSNMSSVAAAIEQTSNNVNTVSRSTEDMTATINEIAKNTEKARGISNEAVSQARKASEKVYELGEAAQDIDKVTETITEISEQTNLLALNATIEAARAGEAGKGFAVVANEVKELARQTADATQKIKDKIESIQNSTGLTIGEIEQITKVISHVNDVVSNVARSAEDQSTTTKDIADSIAQAAQGVQDVSENVSQSSKMVNEISGDIADVNRTASEISGSSVQVNANAANLNKLAKKMNELFGGFKV